MSFNVNKQDEEFLKAAQKLKKEEIEFWKETRKSIFKGIKILSVTTLTFVLFFMEF